MDDLADYRPTAREGELVTQDLPGEVLVYDMRTNRVHCLNESVANVWRLCDGRTRVGEIASQLDKGLGDMQMNEELVWRSLEELQRVDLLTQPLPRGRSRGTSRRELIQKLAYAAVAFPVVSSIIAPAPAAAASGVCATAPCLACTDLQGASTCVAACASCPGSCCRYTGAFSAATSCSVQVATTICSACDGNAACTASSGKCAWRAL